MAAFFEKISKIKPLYDYTHKVLLFVCKLLLIGDIVITLWAVAGRYIPFISNPSWSEELVLTQMVYLAVFSASLAIQKGTHIRMTAFDKAFSRRGLLISDLVSDALVLIFGILILVSGIQLLRSPLCTMGFYTSIPRLSKFWQYLPIAIAGGSMIIFELEQFFLHLETLLTGKEAE